MSRAVLVALLIATISILAGFNFPRASAYEVSYPDFEYRTLHPPTYCGIEPSDDEIPDHLKTEWMNMLEDAVLDWKTQLQNVETENDEYWEMNYLQIPRGESYSDYACSVPIFFRQYPDNPEDYYQKVGYFFPQPVHIDIYYWQYGNCNDPSGAYDCYYTGQFLSLDEMGSTTRHEIGHSLGLGHYTSDDNEVNNIWLTGDTPAPSIMMPNGHRIPSLRMITDIDIEKVRSIYGSYGFYAFSSEGPPEIITPTPTPIPTPVPVSPVHPFNKLDITNKEIQVSRYETQIERIVGDISEDEFLQGHPVFILITKPDQTTEVLKITPTSKGHFEAVVTFDKESQRGYYSVEASYLEHTDREMSVTFRIIDENTVDSSVPNILGKMIPPANTLTQPGSGDTEEDFVGESEDYFQQGYDLLNQGKYKEAIPLFEKSLEGNPDDIYSLNNLGYASNQLSEHEHAIFYTDKALKIDPKNTIALNNKGYALNSLKKYEEAISYFDRTLQLDSKNEYALFQKGYVLGELGKYEDAISYYDKVLQINPRHIDALNNLGYSLNQIGRYEEAISYFNKVLSIDPSYALAQENKEIALDKLENQTGGGCLIATAAFGSELAPQVQQLRELRDNTLLKTESGESFVTIFNQFYYTFSPTVADWERENSVFKEVVRISITPLITTLSILNYVDIDSEAEMIGYGITLILLNAGMYFITPAFVIIRLKHR